VRRLAAIYPTLLRVGLAQAFAYRAEFFVWVLTTNLPLVNLALWTAVARDAPVQGWGQPDFVAYFLVTLLVRLLTGCWVVWEMTMEIRQGAMAMRLLRPVHPLLAYSAENLAAFPMRLVMGLPVIAVLLWTAGPDHLAADPLAWALFPMMLAGAWLMTFFVMSIVGTLSFFVGSAFSVFDVWLGLFTVLSGYLVPLEFFPPWLREANQVLPFRLMLGLPVETLLGRLTRAEMLSGLAWQVGYIAALVTATALVWRRGVRRYAAFGG
jgi:ABC-2 type transport system permease protein